MHNSDEIPNNNIPTCTPTFTLTETTPVTMSNILSELSPSKSCGLEGLTVRLLKDVGDPMVLPLMHVFNPSITQNNFRTERKTECITPLYKEGDRRDPSNDQPISLLSIVSKMLEKIVHEELDASLCYQQFFDNQ